jgi:hypothetical protein
MTVIMNGHWTVFVPCSIMLPVSSIFLQENRFKPAKQRAFFCPKFGVRALFGAKSLRQLRLAPAVGLSWTPRLLGVTGGGSISPSGNCLKKCSDPEFFTRLNSVPQCGISTFQQVGQIFHFAKLFAALRNELCNSLN